jgi:FkbM family methyltransferase
MPGVDEMLVSIGRVIGKPPGWERVVRAVAPPQRFSNGSVRTEETPEGYLFPVDRGTLLGWHVHFFGSYEPEVRGAIKAWLGPGQTALDVGANVGWHTLLMARQVGPEGRVCAFEPNQTTRARLLDAAAANALTHVRVDPRGVAECSGRRRFRAPAAGDLWDGTGRLVGDGAGTDIDCVSLDDFAAEERLDAVGLLKIDVEGWELAVLRGARRVLAAFRPAIVFEYDPAYVVRCGGTGLALSTFLAESRYVMFELVPEGQPRSVSRLEDRGGNFLAVPCERAVR